MSSFDRNFGSIATAREFWGGNNGFLTVGIQMPDADTHLPVGTAYTAAAAKVAAGDATDAEILLVSNAERNLFRIAQAIGQRAVVVAVSAMSEVTATDEISTIFAKANATGNKLASTFAGTSTAAATDKPVFYVTFMIERADVYTIQANKPGSTYAQSVDAGLELAENLQSADMFESKDFQATPMGDRKAGSFKQAVSVGIMVYDALPVLK